MGKMWVTLVTRVWRTKDWPLRYALASKSPGRPFQKMGLSAAAGRCLLRLDACGTASTRCGSGARPPLDWRCYSPPAGDLLLQNTFAAPEKVQFGKVRCPRIQEQDTGWISRRCGRVESSSSISHPSIASLRLAIALPASRDTSATVGEKELHGRRCADICRPGLLLGGRQSRLFPPVERG